MRLVCPNCSSQYEVDISLFPDEGREVQCSNCEEIWFQYPVEDEKPLRLDELADDDADAEDDEFVPPPRPSQRLADEEQRELAAAVEEELAARDSRAERPKTRRKIERAADPVGEDEILSQLRQEIEKEGGNFEGGGPAKSSRRNLEKAAEHAGIAVDDQPSRSSGRWNVSSDDESAESGRGRTSRRRDKKSKRDKKRTRSGSLAAALRDIESADQRASMGFRHGFLTAVIVAMLGSGVYMFRNDIAEAYPPATPWLAQYEDLVTQGRVQAETLYVEYRPVVQDMIDQATAAVGDLTSGGDTATE